MKPEIRIATSARALIASSLFLIAAMPARILADEGTAGNEFLRLQQLPNGLPFPNPTGFAATISSTGRIDLNNEFFQNLGANGRRCVSCHLPSAGWTVTPPQVQAIFDATRGGAIDDPLGLGAIFRTNDGSNSPEADVSTFAARRRAYSMLLTKGLIRVGIGVPATADFELIAIDDPYGHASAAELSLFRRPLPATNLRFLSTVMWDGRETFNGTDHCNLAAEGAKCFASIHFDLSDQANGATQGHAQAPNPLSDAQRESIVAFETALATAQVWDRDAGRLSSAGGKGGPEAILGQAFYYGINDNLGDYRSGAAFNPAVFDLYDTWANRHGGGTEAARRSVARGQEIFNTRPITISGVGGLNLNSPFNPPLPASFQGTCTTCHDAPDSGNHSIVAPLDIGLADGSRRTPDMPLYTLQQKCVTLADGSKAVGPGCPKASVTDPGRALISGQFSDVGKFKGPILRGLAARAPYFHNGSAADLGAVIDFYNERFGTGITGQDRQDLIAFLRSL
ncbi:MAG TPA: cytochrome C [Burkholderiales bacterium]|nr:cytochrome C [Burkholderiales bacterium]